MDRRRAAALIALTVVVVAVVVVLFGPGGSGGYTVTAEVDNAGQMIPGNDVRIGAIKVGKVADIALTDDGTAEIKMNIDGDTAPIPQGTTATIRSTSLFGIANRFVVLQPPSGPSQPLPDGGKIGLADTTAPVEEDALLDVFNSKTRTGLSALIQGGASVYTSQAANVNETIKWLGPTFSNATTVFGQLAKDQDKFASLINQASATARALTSRRAELVDLISNANATTGAIGDQALHLDRTLAQLPATMRRSDTTFVKLREAMDDLDPFVATAKTATRNLTPFLRDARVFTRRARTVVPRAAAIINTKGKANDFRNLLGRAPKLNQVASYAFPNTITFMDRSENLLDLLTAYTPDLFAAVANIDQITANYDANGHYVRVQPVLGAAHYDLGLNELQPQPIADRLNGFQTGVRARCPGGAMQAPPDLSAPVTVPGCNPLLTPPGP